MVREVDHRFEDRPHCVDPDLVGESGGVETACVGTSVPDAIGELVEEDSRVGMWVADDLAAEEAVLRCQVAFDVHEAGDLGQVAVGEQQRRQAPIEWPMRWKRSIRLARSTSEATETRNGIDRAARSEQVVAPHPGAS